YIRPDYVRILVTGDIAMDQLLPALNKAFGGWKAPSSAIPEQHLGKVTPPATDRVFLMNRPGSQQSVIFAGIVAPSAKAPNHLAISIMNGTFGGTFTSRLNMDLREDKHWAYGAHSMVMSTVGPGACMMYAPVQGDKTAPAVERMGKQGEAAVGRKPPASDASAKDW